MTGLTITTWPNLFVPAGTEVNTTWPALVARVLRPKTYRWENKWTRYSLGRFEGGYRSLATFVTAGGLVLDFDAGATRERIAETFGDFYGFAHTTKRSTPALQRWRVAVALDREVDGAEFPRVQRALFEVAERAQLIPDYKARDASRAWAAPSESDRYEAIELRGAFLDVDDALERFPVPPPPERVTRTPTSDDVAHRIERARRYVERMDPAISGSGGHRQTFRAAVALVVGFALPLDAALAILVNDYNPRCSPRWADRELLHKVRSAAKDSSATPGFLADKPRERRTA